MSKEPYTAAIGDDKKHCVEGPGNGFGYYAGTLWPDRRFSTANDAYAAAVCCNEAFQQGMAHAQSQMRKALGLTTPHK